MFQSHLGTIYRYPVVHLRPHAVLASNAQSACCHVLHYISMVDMSAGKSVVCTVWFHRACNLPTMARRLGIVYCLNRPCALYSIEIPFTCKNSTPADSTTQATCLTEGLLSAMSPKFSPRGDKLIFLSHDAAASSGVHSATAALKSIQWTLGTLIMM